MPEWQLFAQLQLSKNGIWVERSFIVEAPTLHDAVHKIAYNMHPTRIKLKEAHKFEPAKIQD